MENKINDLKMETRKTIFNLVVITILIMGVILGASIGSYEYYKDLVIKSQKNNMLQIVTTIASQLEIYFQGRNNYLREVTNEQQFQEEFLKLLQGKNNNMKMIWLLYQTQGDEYKAIELVDKEGVLLKEYTKDSVYNYVIGEDMEKAVRTQKAVYFVDSEIERTINIIQPVIINDECYGFVRIKLDSEYIYDTYLNDYKMNNKGYISVKDRYARLLLHPSNERIGREVVETRRDQFPNYDWSGLEDSVRRQLNKESGISTYYSVWAGDDTRVKKISAFAPCNIGDTFIILNFSADYQETVSNLKGVTNVAILLAILLIFTCICIIVYIYNVEVKKNKLLIESLYLNELKEKNALLMHQSKFAAMGEILATIVHQLKQPLNALKLSLYNIEDYFLLKENDENQLNKLLKSNHKYINKMAETIDDFKFFFKPQDKNAEFSIYEAIEFAVDLNVGRINNFRIEVNIHGDKELKIRGESNILSQVILNILNNSIDAAQQCSSIKKHIDIYIRNDIKYVKIEIIDNAGGMPREVKERLFEPYVTTKGDNGTGLGLYISKIILKEKFNGDLLIEDAKFGTMATIILPGKGGDSHG